MECNVSINFLLAIRQNYSPGTLAFCLIEIWGLSGKFLDISNNMNINFEEEREFVKTNSKEYFSLGNDCFQSNLNNCVNFVTTI